MRSKQMDALRKRMASGGDPFVTDHYGVIIVQMENEEVDLDECPPGLTLPAIPKASRCRTPSHASISTVSGSIQDTAESEFSTPLVSRCPTSSQVVDCFAPAISPASYTLPSAYHLNDQWQWFPSSDAWMMAPVPTVYWPLPSSDAWISPVSTVNWPLPSSDAWGAPVPPVYWPSTFYNEFLPHPWMPVLQHFTGLSTHPA
ncbi:unnamed protein product [Symbiodinium microadriaticum]|nr:unnamed protein product [Symbiodinium microadriaticum]